MVAQMGADLSAGADAAVRCEGARRARCGVPDSAVVRRNRKIGYSAACAETIAASPRFLLAMYRALADSMPPLYCSCGMIFDGQRLARAKLTRGTSVPHQTGCCPPRSTPTSAKRDSHRKRNMRTRQVTQTSLDTFLCGSTTARMAHGSWNTS